jgi:hypothetical protein
MGNITQSFLIRSGIFKNLIDEKYATRTFRKWRIYSVPGRIRTAGLSLRRTIELLSSVFTYV